MAGEPPPPQPEPQPPESKPSRPEVDFDALFPMPERKGLGHVADKWRMPPGRVNAFLIALSVIGMAVLAPSLFRFALQPVEEGAPLFNYVLLLKLVLFLGCLGFFCAACGFRFAHWLAQKITDLIFGDGPSVPPDQRGGRE